MVLTAPIVAELCRLRAGEPDSKNALRYVAAIPDALKRIARKIAADPRLRDLMLTDKTDAVLPIHTGKVNLNDGFENYRFLLEYIDKGRIYHCGSNLPVQLISKMRAGLVQQFAGVFYYAYIEGATLYVIGECYGKLSFAVPSYPGKLDELPESEEIQTMLIEKILEICNLPSDLAGDGEH